MTAQTLNAVAQDVDSAVIDRLFDRMKTVEHGLPDLEFPCVDWTGCVNADGYGQLRTGSTVVLVHRLVWEVCNHQRIPAGLVVLHACDNPRCCEPTHLRLGTHEENVEDRVSKGRSACGERNGRSKLTAVDAAVIRSRCDEPVSCCRSCKTA